MAHVVFGDWPNTMRLIAVGERTPNSLQVSNGNVCADPGQYRTERIYSICGNRLNWRRLMISLERISPFSGSRRSAFS